MWMLGFLSYYVFHLVAFRYYMGMFAKPTLQRPMASMYRWFHPAVYAVCVVLLVTSAFFFFLSSPWLSIAPMFLLGLSWIITRVKYGNRMNNIIKKATEIQVRMERGGLSQTEINKAIYLGATGELYPLESDSDLKSFLRYCVLSQVLGFDAHEDMMQSIENAGKRNYVSTSSKIDAGVDHFYQYWCKVYGDIEMMKQ